MRTTGNWVPYLLLGYLLGVSLAASAYPVKWTLGNVSFENGSATENSIALEGFSLFSDDEVPAHTAATNSGSIYSKAFGAAVVDVSLLGGVCNEYRFDYTGESFDQGYCGSAEAVRISAPGARRIGAELKSSRSVLVPEPDIVVLMGLGVAAIFLTRISMRQNRRKTFDSES